MSKTIIQKQVYNIIEKDSLNKHGYAFFAYPKKGNKRYPTFIHRDNLLEGLNANEKDGFLGSSNLKFSRMVGLDETFTVVGLKEASKEKNRLSTEPGQCVDDYLDMIPFIKRFTRYTAFTYFLPLPYPWLSKGLGTRSISRIIFQYPAYTFLDPPPLLSNNFPINLLAPLCYNKDKNIEKRLSHERNHL